MKLLTNSTLFSVHNLQECGIILLLGGTKCYIKISVFILKQNLRLHLWRIIKIIHRLYYQYYNNNLDYCTFLLQIIYYYTFFLIIIVILWLSEKDFLNLINICLNKKKKRILINLKCKIISLFTGIFFKYIFESAWSLMHFIFYDFWSGTLTVFHS